MDLPANGNRAKIPHQFAVENVNKNAHPEKNLDENTTRRCCFLFVEVDVGQHAADTDQTCLVNQVATGRVVAQSSAMVWC
jgi:hypothetical protein